MVLYKRTFPLGEGVSFSSYIKALAKKKFPKYYLRMEKTSCPTSYHGTLVFTVPNWEWGLRGQFINGVLLKHCTIQYLEGEQQFTIQASARPINLFLAFFMMVCAIILFIFELFMIVTNNQFLNNILIPAGIIVLVSIPPLSIYLQDKHFLDKVGSLGTDLKNNK